MVKKCEDLFLYPQFYSVDLYVYPMPVLHCVYYYSHVVKLEIVKCKSPNFVLFRDGFGYLVLQISICILGLACQFKERNLNFDRYYITLYINLRV